MSPTVFAGNARIVELPGPTASNEYDKCSLDPIWKAPVEQQAVFDAFTAIGHPSSGTLNECN